jgi:predicted regulator of Ras-like GTPase activity (Roadblock/LC7/MglB family)
MEWVFTFTSFELGLLFLIKYKKQPNGLKNSQDLGFLALFCGLSLMRFFFLISGYYSTDIIISPFFIWQFGSFKNLFLNFGFLSIMIGTFFLTFFMEKNKKFLFKKYFFSSCFFIQLCIFLILFLSNLEIFISLSILLWPLFILFFVVYIKDFNKKIKNQEILPKGGLKMTLVILLILGGFILSMDMFSDIFGLTSRLIGVILQLIALGLIFFFFRKIPPFFEFDWQDKIESIYIMNKDGVCLFDKSFTDNTETLSSQFISGVLASVNTMLNELIRTNENEISIIKKKGKVVNIFSGSYVTGVLISKEELEYFKHNLKKVILKVEKIYKNILIKWNGDLTIFYPIKNIIDSTFLI